VDFRKKPAKTPLAQHDTIDKRQKYQGLDDAGGAGYFSVIFSVVSFMKRTLLLPLARTLFYWW
jgi:hypothetical protein